MAGSLNTSKGFQEFNKSVRFGFGAWTAKGIASDLVGAWKANTAVKEATKATQINANAATRQAQISADALANQPLP